MNIQKAGFRAKLKPRREPYWRELEQGFYIGFRKVSTEGGTWMARWRDPETRKQHWHRLGKVAVLKYASAAAEAARWRAQCRQGVTRAERTTRMRREIADGRPAGDAVMPAVDQKGAASQLGVSPRTLEKWRLLGNGPAFFKLGSRVVYDTAELDLYMAARRRTSTAK
jgi:hypothetical protein